jgi:hypothetical protein
MFASERLCMARLLVRTLVIALFALVAVGCAESHHATPPGNAADYNKPLLSPGAMFAALPPAVQNTIRAETGGAAISDIVKDSSSGRLVYRVYFQNPAHFPPLNIAPDGSLLDSNLAVAIPAPEDRSTGGVGKPEPSLTLSDLPPAVVKTIQRQAPDSEVDSIFKEVHRDQTSYLITFKNHMHPALRVASDGTVL